MRIDYNMTKEYRSHWSAYDAVREMVQNASDEAHNYECEISSTRIIVENEGSIPLETLMLGESQKSSDSVGRYGEGYKIGMMILTREGLKPSIWSGKYKFTGSFEKNELGVETFGIIVEEDTYTDTTTFACLKEGLDIEELKRRIPAFDKPLINPGKHSGVTVLADRPGQIYVNGLWVCEAKLTHGYNFHPNHIELNTDRNMVSGVHWHLAKFYGECNEQWAEHIFKLLESDANDVADLSYRLHNPKLKAELARLFFNKYGDGAKIARPGTTYLGGHSYVSTSSSASRVYSTCGIKEGTKKADPNEPHVVLEAFIAKHRSKLRRDVKRDAGILIERAKSWSKSNRI